MSASTSSSSSSMTFEFTKRKRWADLLIHELSDAIIFILSPNAKIWFCGRAVSELLGWSNAELIDRPFTDLVNPEDQRTFHIAFDDSLHTHTEMNAYLRLKARFPLVPSNIPQSELLFEVKGYPHLIENELTARCLFAVAKPYPSRNVAVVNAFLELKIENERLQKRLAELRSPRSSSVSGPAAPSPPLRSLDVSNSLYPQHLTRSSCDNFGPSGSQAQSSPYESHGPHTYTGQYTSASSAQPADGDLSDDTLRRKRIRKSHSAEQYVCVTCGRTDSPEWRKGPQGPKTLCNACGLRWAKEVRSKIDENAAAGTSGTANNA